MTRFAPSLRRRLLAGSLASVSAIAVAGPGPDEVGDPDSFGRAVIYLGVASTPSITLKADCLGSPPPAPARCVTLSPQPALTSFTVSKLDALTIPAKSTNSLLCFAVTPSMAFMFNNQTGVAQPMARFTARPTLVLENEVLNDPSLIDPTTNAPFNGRISLSLGTYNESRNMAVGEREYKQMFLSRHCIDGMSRRVLTETYGLPESIADDFFAHPIHMTFGAAGEAQLVENAGYYYGVRVYGDAP